MAREDVQMSEDAKDGEIISPRLPATGPRSSVAMSGSVERMPASNPNGIVDSAVTQFVAGLRRKANAALAADAHARADYFDAVERAAKSYVGMNQAINEINELDDILALDRMERGASREERYAEIEHRKRLAEQRHRQELTEAERGAFNADQGYENQKRLKELNLEIWERRREAEQLDAAAIAARLRGDAEPQAKKRGGLVEELQAQADKLEKEILEANADGRDTGGDLMALAELKALIARLRGR
jgi:hypothetical protein